MNIDKKIFVIQGDKEATIAALNSYLDYIYNLHEMFFDENNRLRDGLQTEPELENIIISSKENAAKFEKVREKLINDDFNLSLLEINYIALAYYYARTRMEITIKNLTKAIENMKLTEAILFEGTDLNPETLPQKN